MNGFSAADMTDARAKGYQDRVEFERYTPRSVAFDSTPAAPGIDLSKLQRYRMASDANDVRNLYKDDTGTWVKIQDVERALIDASPKGDIDPLCAAKRPGCNYPACGCTDASPKGGSEALVSVDDLKALLRPSEQRDAGAWDRVNAIVQATSAEVGS